MLNKIIIISLVLLSLLSACKNRRKLKAAGPAVVVIQADSSKSDSSATMLSLVLKPWTYFSAKIDVEYSSGEDKKMNPSANIRMYKDSLIWISAGMFGIEGIRILINKDSAVIMNKLEKTYSVYTPGDLAGMSDLPLSVSQIQNLIMARPVYALELYQKMIRNESRINIYYDQQKFETSHLFNKLYLTIDTTLLRDKIGPYYAEFRYTSYTVVSGYNFPVQTYIKVNGAKKVSNISLHFFDVDFESVLSFPFTIPSTYTRTKSGE